MRTMTYDRKNPITSLTRPLPTVPPLSTGQQGRVMNQAKSGKDEAFRRRFFDNIMVTKLRELRRADINPYLKAQDPVGLDEVVVDGKRMIQLGSSNYLGLAQDPRVIGAALEAVETYGTSCTASRLLTGTRPLHEELEACLAKFLGKEDALAFTTGYLAAI